MELALRTASLPNHRLVGSTSSDALTRGGRILRDPWVLRCAEFCDRVIGYLVHMASCSGCSTAKRTRLLFRVFIFWLETPIDILAADTELMVY